MSKAVRIPDSMNPFVVIINGVKYEYPSGKVMVLPDNIVSIIEGYEKGNFPQPTAPATEIVAVSSSGDRFTLTVSDAGKLNIEKKVDGKKIIEFKVEDITLTAEEGMTWREWLASEYNPAIVCKKCGGDATFYVSDAGSVALVDGCYDECVGTITYVAVYESKETMMTRQDEMYVDLDDSIEPSRIYGYTTALDGIKRFLFSIDGTIYVAEEGMTWADWVDSEYNPSYACVECGKTTKRIINEGNKVSVLYNNSCAECLGACPELVTVDAEKNPTTVKPSDTIIEGDAYEAW